MKSLLATKTFRQLLTLMGEERKNLYVAMIFIFINSGLNLVGPYLMGHAVDNFVVTKHYEGVIKYSIILFGVFAVALVRRIYANPANGKSRTADAI